MTSFVLQAAPANGCASLATVCTSPLVIRTFLSVSPEKNPTHSPLGDQKGADAPSDPTTSRSDPASNDLSHSCFVPSSFWATKAMFRPSADNAKATSKPE